MKCAITSVFYLLCGIAISSAIPARPETRNGDVASSSIVYKGVDISSLLLVEQEAKSTFKACATCDIQPLEWIVKQSGLNIVRLRLWYTEDPTSTAPYSLQYNLALAKRLHAAGLMIYLDMFYCETWADPGNNWAPKAWRSYNLPQMQQAVTTYTKMVMNTFQSAKIPLEMVSLGNEITYGMLWPLGGAPHMGANFTNLAPLLKTASQAIKSSNMKPTPKVMTHLDGGPQIAKQSFFYDNVFSHGLSPSDIDIIGGTFYPFWSARDTQAHMVDSFTQLSQKWNKPCMVVETNWPISCTNPAKISFATDLGGLVTLPNGTVTGTKEIPFSVQGQAQWLRLIAASLNAVPNKMGQGLMYWEPAWLDNPKLGTACDDDIMFSVASSPDNTSTTGTRLVGTADDTFGIWKDL